MSTVELDLAEGSDAWHRATSDLTDPVVNPASNAHLAEIPRSSADDVDRMVDAAAKAFPDWSSTTPGERARALLRIADDLEQDAAEFALLESRNVGKPIALAQEEVEMIVDHLRFFAGAARLLEGRAAGEYMPGHTSFLRRDPLGVIGSVAPWNYPLLMAIWKICPALMTGNTLVLKPSEHTPLTALRFARLAAEHLPPGVLGVVTGDGSVGDRLVHHDLVRMSSLTGSTRTGRHLLHASAEGNLKRLHLELGGKAPVLVFPDADVDLTVAKIVEGAFCNSGQDCMAASRLYLHESVHDEVVTGLTAAMNALVVGDPVDETTTMGPVITAAHQARVEGFVQRAKETGHIDHVQSGRPDNGSFVAPTLLLGARQGDEAVQQEIFGPVVTVTKFGDGDDVVALANDSKYGLAASVFSSDVARVLRLSRDLQFGTVWINDHLPVVPEMPHGGFKESGHGNDMSVYSLEEYTKVKHVMVNLGE